jgi:hypothetical protein
MRQQDVFKKIGNILQELNEQYEYLKTQGDSIDDLELELFAANSHFLSDHLEVLRKLNASLAKSLPAHEPQAATELPVTAESFEPHVIEEPATAVHEPETIVEPPIAFVEEVPEQEKSEPEHVIELPAESADEIPEEEAPTLQEYFHVETPETHTEEEAEPEAAPEPGGGFHFDFETAEQPQEDADEYTSNQFQYQPEETEEETHEPVIDEEAEEIVESEEHIEETPTPSFEPAEQPIEIADGPAPEIDIKPDTDRDTFSFMRTTEPETIRHELTLDEAEAWASNDEDEAGTINASYHKEEEPEQPTVAEAMAATITPEPTPEPVAFKPQPEPAPIPTYQLNQTPPTAPNPEPAAATEPERPLTLNERLSAQAAANASTPAASAAPIKDLKSAITLNDKMLFVRDLFNGYSLAYSEAIEILNRFNNFDDAERFLKTNYVEKNHWADKPATNEKFFDLLKRRFA